MRVAITTQAVATDGKTPVGEETLRIVYAKDNETGEGNDSTAKAGWTSIQKVNGKPKLDTVTYPYVYTGYYTDQRITGAKTGLQQRMARTLRFRPIQKQLQQM